MVSDVAGAVRAALTHRANTPDLYTIMQIMGEEAVRERFKNSYLYNLILRGFNTMLIKSLQC